MPTAFRLPRAGNLCCSRLGGGASYGAQGDLQGAGLEKGTAVKPDSGQLSAHLCESRVQYMRHSWLNPTTMMAGVACGQSVECVHAEAREHCQVNWRLTGMQSGQLRGG
jgi:hypothetical protein